MLIIVIKYTAVYNNNYAALCYFLLVQECVGRVSDLIGCEATDVKVDVLEQLKQQEAAPDLTSECPLTSETTTPVATCTETGDEEVVKSYSKLVSLLAAVGVALLAVAMWFVYSLQSASTSDSD